MALLRIDGFDAYGANGASLDAILQTAGYVAADCAKASTDVRAGTGKSLQFTIGSADRGLCAIRYAFEAKDTIIIGFAFKYNKTNWKALVGFGYDNYLGTVTIGAGVWVNASGGISFTLGTDTLLKASAPNILSSDVWHFCEIRYTPHATNGSIVCRIDGVECVAFNGQTTLTTLPNTVNMMKIGAAQSDYWNQPSQGYFNCWVDDLYVCDTLGTEFNDFLGDCVVQTLLPESDAGPNDLSLVGNTTYAHYSCVADTVPDEDTSYLYGNTNGAREVFGLPDLPTDVLAVLAVAIDVRAKKVAAGDSTFKMLAKVDTDEVLSGAQSLVSKWLTRQFVMENAPGGGDWTVNRVNGLNVGFELEVGS